MRLLFVVPCYLPATRFGGPIQSIHQLARGLVSQGHEVHVFTTNSNGPDDLAVPLEAPCAIEGVSVTYFQVGRPRGYFRSPSLRRRLAREVRAFDLVYAAWMYADTTMAAAARSREAGVPYVVSPRGMLDAYAFRRKGHWKKRLFMAALGARALRDAAAIHFTSEGERRNSVVPVAPERSIVIPNGIDAASLAAVAAGGPASVPLPGLEGDGPVVLFLGRLSYIKGLDLLSAAWPRVVKDVPSARLVIAGADDEGLLDGLRRTWGASGAAASITYAGMVERATADALLRRASVLVSPSWLESFGMSIVEAMAAGKPVVVTDRVNIAPEIEAAGAGWVTPCEPERIAAALVEALRDPARAHARGEAGRSLVADRYAAQNVARRMSVAMAALVDRRKT